jgi:hypothetical protein
MTAASDPYRVLGLEPGASQAEIKRAYRRLAKILHPDSAGERSLPAFLAVQDAYERLTGTKVRTVRWPGTTTGAARPGADTGAGAFREPWRADPARARAAREQARARTGSTGGTAASGASGATAGGKASWTRPGSTTGSTRRDRGSTGAAGTSTAGNSTAGADRTASGAGPAAAPGGTTGRRRRSTRKATMGSTSYDEARDATDPRWAGASWYGPTTGEYWMVNPREYADPRKHGPGYSGRVRSGHEAPGPPPVEPSVAETSWEPAAGEAVARPQPETWASATAAAPGPSATPPTEASLLDALIGRGPADPLRRLGLVLLAWAPIGIAAAGIIGQATGCGSYSAACDGLDPFLPWVAQAAIVGLLLLVAPLARVLAAGAIGVLVGLLPGTGFVIALGGARSAAAAPVVAVILAIAWVLGVGWGVRRVVAARTAAGEGSSHRSAA